MSKRFQMAGWLKRLALMPAQSKLNYWIINNAKSSWVAFTRKKMRLEKTMIVSQMILHNFWKPLRATKHALYFSYCQPLLLFLPACVDRRKINLGVGVLVQDSMIVMTLNLTGWTPINKPPKNTNPIYFSLRQHSCSFFPARVATRKINLGVGVLVWDPMVWIRCIQCLLRLLLLPDVLNHAYGLGWPPTSLEAICSWNFGDRAPIN